MRRPQASIERELSNLAIDILSMRETQKTHSVEIKGLNQDVGDIQAKMELIEVELAALRTVMSTQIQINGVVIETFDKKGRNFDLLLEAVQKLGDRVKKLENKDIPKTMIEMI